MDIPGINIRIRQLIDFYTKGSVKKFAESINIDQQKLNRLFNIDTRTGKYPVATTDIIRLIVELYVHIDAAWLLTGQGEMLKNHQKTGNNVAVVGGVNGNNAIVGSNVNSDGNTIHGSAMSEVATEREKNYQEVIKKLQEQIDRLLGMIEKFSTNH